MEEIGHRFFSKEINLTKSQISGFELRSSSFQIQHSKQLHSIISLLYSCADALVYLNNLSLLGQWTVLGLPYKQRGTVLLPDVVNSHFFLQYLVGALMYKHISWKMFLKCEYFFFGKYILQDWLFLLLHFHIHASW